MLQSIATENAVILVVLLKPVYLKLIGDLVDKAGSDSQACVSEDLPGGSV